MSALALVLSVVLASASASAPSSADGAAVRVELLGRTSPSEVLLWSGGRSIQLSARGDTLLRGGTVSIQPLALGPGPWRVGVLGDPDRTYVGALEARAQAGAVRLVLLAPLEWYVARVVASETPPGTLPEALRAQAVVVRSFALARDRHRAGGLCDLAHCQLLRGHGVSPSHTAAAEAAAVATAGTVLRLASGRIAEAVFHGACGGHTADPREVFGSDATGAATVPDPGCAGPDWSAEVPAEVLLAAARASLVAAGSAASSALGLRSASDVELVRGAGGWIVQVASRDGARASGDAFVRALDRALGWNQVRSARFRVEPRPSGGFHVVGSGLGHGVGLCQAGAARRARGGDTYTAILAHYFPDAALGR